MKINGPIEVLYIVTALFLVITVLFLMGKCSWLIAGYNTSSKEEKEKYDERKLCTVIGLSCSIIDIMLLILCFFWKTLPAYFVYIFGGVSIVDSLIAIILSNTICKKK